MVKPKKYLIWIFTTILMSACASVYEGKYNWDDGWRKGHVIEVGPYSRIKHRTSDACSKSLQANADDKVAIVEYQRGRYRNWVILKQTEETNSQVGDLVYVNIKECDLPLVMRSESK